MSATHLRLGSAAEKSRPKTFSATGRPCEEVVVALNFRFVFDRKPCCFISLATVLTQQGSPAATNAAWTRGLPYTRRLLVWAT